LPLKNLSSAAEDDWFDAALRKCVFFDYLKADTKMKSAVYSTLWFRANFENLVSP